MKLALVVISYYVLSLVLIAVAARKAPLWDNLSDPDL